MRHLNGIQNRCGIIVGPRLDSILQYVTTERSALGMRHLIGVEERCGGASDIHLNPSYGSSESSVLDVRHLDGIHNQCGGTSDLRLYLIV
jgi:hypothetical protein